MIFLYLNRVHDVSLNFAMRIEKRTVKKSIPIPIISYASYLYDYFSYSAAQRISLTFVNFKGFEVDFAYKIGNSLIGNICRAPNV